MRIGLNKPKCDHDVIDVKRLSLASGSIWAEVHLD